MPFPCLLALLLSCACSSPRRSAASEASGSSRPRASERESGDELGENPTLDEYVAFALAHEPGLRAAYEDYIAASEHRAQVDRYPDPRLSYRYYAEEVETRVGPQRQSLGLAQTVPWFGKLDLRGDVGDEQARAALARYDARRAKVAADVARAYYELYYFSRALDVVRRRVELVRSLEAIARARYSTGSARQPDVVRAQVELGRLEDQLRTLADSQRPLATTLNAALGRPTDSVVALPTAVLTDPLNVDRERLMTELASSNPELAAASHEVKAASHAVELAKLGGRPDFTFGIDWIETLEARTSGVDDSGKDPLILGLSLNLPLDRGKYGAEQAEARARLRAAIERRDALENTLAARLESALYAARDTHRKVDLYRDALIPMAQEALSATETSYRAGQSSFTDMIDAERTLLEFELASERALADHGQALAEVERIVGRSVRTEQGEVEGTQRHPTSGGQGGPR